MGAARKRNDFSRDKFSKHRSVFRTAYERCAHIDAIRNLWGPLSNILQKWGVDNSFFTVKLANIQKFLPQLPHQTLRFLKITVNIVNRSGMVLIKYWETGLLSFSHTFLHAIS